MARVAAFIPDLLFGSRVLNDLQAAGHEVTLVASPDGAGGADALVVDLTADVETRIAAVGRPGIPVLAFYSHVEVDVREQALAAGFDLVVPRSRVAREGARLLEGLLGRASGPGLE